MDGRISAATALAAIGLAACGARYARRVQRRGRCGHRRRRGRSRSVSSSTNPASASRRAAPTRGSTSTSRTTSPRRLELHPDLRRGHLRATQTLIKSGQVKYIVGTYSITDARKKDVAFAGPYFIAGQDLLIRSDDTSITGPDSLKGEALLGQGLDIGRQRAEEVRRGDPGSRSTAPTRCASTPSSPARSTR